MLILGDGSVNFIRTHKKESIVIGTFIVIFLILFLFLKIFFFSSSGNVYGDRLDDIDKVKISKDKLQKLENELSQNGEIESADVYITGKVINLFLDVTENASLDALQTILFSSIENFSEKEQELYDIQVYFVSSSEPYPVIGYKGKDEEAFAWTNS